jgi:hypothetical protein
VKSSGIIWQQESCEPLIAFFQFHAVRFEEHRLEADATLQPMSA